MKCSNCGMNSVRYILLIVFVVPVVFGALFFFDGVSDDYQNERNVPAVNSSESSGINLFENLNTLKDPMLKSNTEDLFSSPLVQMFNAFIIILAVSLSFLCFKQFEKTYAVFLFGIYISIAHSLIFNAISYYYSRQWCLQFAFENLLMLLGVGLFASLFITAIHYFKNIAAELPEPDFNLKQYFVFRLKYNFLEYNLATLQSWIIIAITITGMFLVS